MDLPLATLEDAVNRVIIPLKLGNPIAHALQQSKFLNAWTGDHPKRTPVIPTPDDLIEFKKFSSDEYAITLLPEEVEAPGRVYCPKYYLTPAGERKRVFSDNLGHELEGKTVYVVLSPSTDQFWYPDQMCRRMEIAVATAKEIGAEKVIAVYTEFLFGRQDRGANTNNRKDKTGFYEKDKRKHAGQTSYVRVNLRNLIANGCDGVVCVHSHSQQLEEEAQACLKELGRSSQRYTFDIQPQFLLARYLQVTEIIPDELKQNAGEGIVFISPDAGAFGFTEELRRLTGFVNAGLAYVDKERLRSNDPNAFGRSILIPKDGSNGDYRGKAGLMSDDMIDTFGTGDKAIAKVEAEILRIIVYATHGVFAENAEHLMRRRDMISDVILMDTRPSRVRSLAADAKRKVTLLKPAEMIAYCLAQCVEKGIDPNNHMRELFERDPAIFDRLYRARRFDQHYTRN